MVGSSVTQRLNSRLTFLRAFFLFFVVFVGAPNSACFGLWHISKMSDPGEDLYVATLGGDEAAVRALLGQGLDPDEWRDWGGRTALHKAACNGHTGVVRLLIEARADVRTEDDDVSPCARS